MEALGTIIEIKFNLDLSNAEIKFFEFIVNAGSRRVGLLSLFQPTVLSRYTINVQSNILVLSPLFSIMHKGMFHIFRFRHLD